MVRCFSVSDNHGQTSDVIWHSTTWSLIFWLEVASKKPLFTKPAIAEIENFHCVKKVLIFTSTKFCTPGCYIGKMLFAVRNNASKIIRNWFFTLQPDIFTIIYNLPKWAK